MSGHSKWAKIHRAKEASDQKRGQSFTKLSNAITLSVREGGGITDPEFNFRLRLAVEKAREANMPKDNIQRAIDRAAGKGEGNTFEEILYEGYGPGGVGFLVQSVTDNKQRTVQEVKNIFDRAGGSVASPGSVSFNFKKVGQILVNSNNNFEEVTLALMDIPGVEDVEDEGDGLLAVYTNFSDLGSVREEIIKKGMVSPSAEVIFKPINFVPVGDSKASNQIFQLIEKLEDLDDVQKVFANFDIPDELVNEQ